MEELSYGNCDISDWEGRLNTNNSNRALTGFWIESSLKISPLEQAETMERIFGDDSVYSEKTRDELKKVMLVGGRESDGYNGLWEDRNGQGTRYCGGCVVYSICGKCRGKSFFLRISWKDGRQGCIQHSGERDCNRDCFRRKLDL